MTSIGDTLRRERQKRNLDLPKIAAELKISVRFLEAMEHDDFGKLPGGVFTKSFVRQYAGFLGLDADELASEVSHTVEPEPDGAQIVAKPKPDVPGIEIEMGEDSWQSVRERRLSLPSWLKSGVLLVILMLLCSGVYWWWGQRPHHAVLAHEIAPPPKSTPAPQPAPAPPVSQPAENPPSAAAEVPTQATAERSSEPPAVAEASVGLPGTSTPIAPAPNAATPPATTPPAPAVSNVPVPPPNPNATVHVGIVADEAVWVRADVNGKYQFAGTLQPHESRTIDADGQVVLRLGNAGGATLTLNGKPVGTVGPKGQVRIVQFTSGGAQILSVPKLVDPLDRL